MGARLLGVSGRIQREGIVIHLVAEKLWDWSDHLDRIAETDEFHLEQGRGDEVRTDPGDRRTTNGRHPRNVRSGPREKPAYDRSRIVLDRPAIRIHSRDFH
jgi:error-prone DNA polymerase